MLHAFLFLLLRIFVTSWIFALVFLCGVKMLVVSLVFAVVYNPVFASLQLADTLSLPSFLASGSPTEEVLQLCLST